MERKFEVVMLEIGKAVAHVQFARLNLLFPDALPIAQDTHSPGYVVEMSKLLSYS